jgi:hypothetical protein
MKTFYSVEYTVEYYSSMFDKDVEYERREFKTKKEAIKFLKTLLHKGEPAYPYSNVKFYKKTELNYDE